MGTSTRLAPRMAAVKPSPTAAVSTLMRELAEQGREVINLGEGELDFSTPDYVKQAGIEAIENDFTKYTEVTGIDALKSAIAQKLLRDSGYTYSPEQIIAASGGKQIIFNAMLATLDVGDEVVIPAPYWVSYPDIVRLTGATPVIVECGRNQKFKLTPSGLREALNANTRWLILNSPNNPTGAVYSRDELSALLDVLDDFPDVLVLADDIYEHLTYESAGISPIACRPDLAERLLTVNGVSKLYAMTGWRIGYAAGPNWLIKAMTTLQSQSTTSAASMCQVAAGVALENSLEFLQPRLAELRARRDVVVSAIGAIDGLDCDTPEGAFYVYVDCKGLLGRDTPAGKRIDSDVDLAAYLASDAGVGVVPGTAFGLAPYLRIAYGLSRADIERAMAQITEACAALS